MVDKNLNSFIYIFLANGRNPPLDFKILEFLENPMIFERNSKGMPFCFYNTLNPLSL